MNPSATYTNRGRLATVVRAAASLTLFALVASLVRSYPPDQHSFYPRCPIFFYFHIQCPGCGTTRAMAALLHGHLREAIHDNALTTLLLPFALVFAAIQYWRKQQQDLSIWQPDKRLVFATVAITAIFTVARNLRL